MGLFGQSVGFDADVEKATSETNTNENWTLILDVCDKTSSNPRNAKDCLKAIMKRMGHNDPHVVMQAITLLDACVSNCGKAFHLEIASREFQNEFLRLLAKSQPKVIARMCQVLKSWAEGEFSSDPELNLIPSLFDKLRQENYEFASTPDKPLKSSAKATAVKDPSVKQEEDDLAKAIALSLKEAKNSPKHAAASTSANKTSQYPSLYPSMPTAATTIAPNNQPEPRKVRALYDFEAAEENELTFVAGDIIHVTDDSDPNWWKGYSQRGNDGLFPSNFVTSDLSVDVEHLEINQQHKIRNSTQFEENARELQQKTEAAAVAVASEHVDINEQKIDRLLHLLNEANPEDPSQDTEEMLHLEQEVIQMGPLIDAELERVDRKHAQLSQLSSDLVDAINLYHSLMRDDRNMSPSSFQFPGSVAGLSGAAPYLGLQQQPHLLYRTGATFQSNYGPRSLQSGLSSLQYPGPSGNIHTQMGMTMQYPSGQHQHQGLSTHSIPNSQISAHPIHSQQLFQSVNGQSQIVHGNVGPNGESFQQNSLHQPFQVIPLTQSFGPPISPAGVTSMLPANQTHTPQTEPNQQIQYMSPQSTHQQQQQQPQPSEASVTNSHHHALQNGHVSYIANQPQQMNNSPFNIPPASAHEQQLGQLDQQMTNMSIANQPYPTNMQHNIPIYQQQR